MDDSVVAIIRALQDRVGTLERRANINEVVIPTGGKLVVDSLTADPAIQNGRIYYNSTTNKLRGCENGAWVNLV